MRVFIGLLYGVLTGLLHRSRVELKLQDSYRGFEFRCLITEFRRSYGGL